jgi:DNA-binding transcriptional LysR family regulator
MRRLDNIDLRLLRVFVTLAEAQGFAEAQFALNLSASTLSTHLAALERKIGGRLCDRGRGGFRLTPFGEATYKSAKQLFADLESFSQRIGQQRGQLVGRLRIGIVDGVLSSPELGIQTAIGRFMARAADVTIDLMLGTPLDLERAIADGQRDIVIGPFSQRAPSVAYVPLHREPQALYCGREHALFAVPAAEIDEEAIARSAFSVRAYRNLDDLYRVNHPRASATVMQMEAQSMLILSGHYLGFLPRHIGEGFVERRLMRAIRPEIYGYDSQHFAAMRRGEASSALLRAFVPELKRQARAAKVETAPQPQQKVPA